VDISRLMRREALPNVNYYLSCVLLGNTLCLRGAAENNSEDLNEAMTVLTEVLGGLVRL